MFGAKEKVQLAQLQTVLVKSQRGVYKRIDENRELLQLLQKYPRPWPGKSIQKD